MYLNIDVWLEHYIFFLTTIAIIYPNNPNTQTKKKYYDLIINLPTYFIPPSSNNFSSFFRNLINLYPISSYLDNKECLCKWIWFIINKINNKLEKPQISLEKFYFDYYNNYKPKNIKLQEYIIFRKKLIYISVVLFLAIISVYTYKYL